MNTLLKVDFVPLTLRDIKTCIPFFHATVFAFFQSAALILKCSSLNHFFANFEVYKDIHSKFAVDKIQEEIIEVMDEFNVLHPNRQAIEEIGDLLFAVVNLSRHLNVLAETALRKANKNLRDGLGMSKARLKRKNLILLMPV